MTLTNAEAHVRSMSTLSKQMRLRQVASSALQTWVCSFLLCHRPPANHLGFKRWGGGQNKPMFKKSSGIPPWQEFPTCWAQATGFSAYFKASIESVIWTCDIQQTIQSYFLRSHSFEFNRGQIARGSEKGSCTVLKRVCDAALSFCDTPWPAISTCRRRRSSK